MSRRFAVIYEAQADFLHATELADRVLVEQIEWLDETQLDSQRQWIGEESPGVRLTWKSIPARARAAGVRVHGHFSGEPGLPDAQAARRAIVYVLGRLSDIEAIVLMRDADDQPERRSGLEQARRLFPCPIVIGVAICERESWVISGFNANDEAETQRLNAECQRLGGDPRHRSHELRAVKNDAALRSPKRVLSVLTDNDRERERECWAVTPLDQLRERGEDNGITEYLSEVQSTLVPLITGHAGGR